MVISLQMLVDIFFRVVNFGLFLAFVVYYVRKNVIGSIRNHLIGKKTFVEDMIRQDADLKSEQARLEGQLEHQNMVYRELDGKVERWRLGVEADRQKSKDAYADRIKMLNDRLERQYASYASYKAAGEILPKAFDGAIHELRDIFHDKHVAQTYNQKALEVLSRSCKYQMGES